MGLLYAFVAILGWGLGDFLIQRSARKLGDWEALFFVVLVASIILLPFTYLSLSALTTYDWLVLTLTSVMILVASLLDFEALRVGKISIVEPIFAMEVPVTVALATFVVGEHLSTYQLTYIGLLLLGIVLVSNRYLGRMHLRAIEKGVWVAVLTTIGMGTANFLYGFGSRATDPLVITWFTSIFMTVATFVYLVRSKQVWKLGANWRHNKWLILAVGMADTAAWVGYSASSLYIPIGLVTGLTESYIALAAILGLVFNRERIVAHQKLGLVLTVCAAIALALTTTG
jgi:drug/metabolite transporter (DMT)-like permease